jgi:hypothetical protein
MLLPAMSTVQYDLPLDRMSHLAVLVEVLPAKGKGVTL